MVKTLSISIFSLGLVACSMDASITSLTQSEYFLESNRNTPDFLSGEMVQTSVGTPGYEINAVFGEVSGPQTTSSGYQIEGVFQ